MKDGIIKKILSNKLFLVSLFMVLLLVILVASIGNREDPNATPGEYVDKDTPGFFEYKKESFLPSSNLFVNQQLGKDIAFYARNFVDPYKSQPNEMVLLKLSKASYKEGEFTIIRGKLTKNKDELEIKYKELKNSRVSVSVKNLKTKKEEFASLPSNSKRNVFIASLPIATNNFSIDYLVQSDAFTIFVSSLDDEIVDQAMGEIKTKLGITDFKTEKVTVKYEGTPGSGVPYSLD